MEKKTIKKKVIYDIEKLKKSLKNNIAPRFDIDVQPSSWVLNNRVKFSSWLDTKFKYSKKKKCASCDTCPKQDDDIVVDKTLKIDTVNLFPHQKFIKDYIQFESPYRGVLLYHGLGVGKSCSSVAAAELLMNHLDVVVMLPAALKNNYINEIKKCGKRFYNYKQHWEFVPIESFQNDISEISKLSHISIDLIKKNNGLWIPLNKEANFYELKPEEQKQISEQIDTIINNKISFINYNGLKTKNITDMVEHGLQHNSKPTDSNNPFDNKCVVVDEIHNLISRIVNGGKIGTALYKLLMTAKNCKLILLSGTPVINYPYEIAFLINLITGYQKLYILQILKNNVIYNKTDIIKILEKVPQIDRMNYDENAKKISFTLLPSGFEYSNREKSEIKRSTIIESDKLLENILEILKKHSINISKKISTREFKLLPENQDEFNKYFVDMEKGTIINSNLFSRRILGTVSYYSTYSPELYPSVNINEINEFMTDYQFHKYEKSRYEERKKESKAKKKGDGNVFNDSGQVYRFYSRADCNFVFPEEIVRPFPNMSQLKKEIDVTDDAVDQLFDKIINKAEETENNDAQKTKAYEKALQNALELLSNTNTLHINNIDKFSPKFKKIFEFINNINGTSLVYSQFRKVEGLGVFALMLKANGYAEFKIKKNKNEWVIDINDEDMDKPKFIIFTGNNEETQILLKIFNSDFDNVPTNIQQQLKKMHSDNIRGNIIKTLMITQSGAEGISLKNVRQVHIIEPYWNYIRIDQVIGRAVRTCSHIDLPRSDRNVSVYIYNMKFTPEQLKSSHTLRTHDNGLTTDEYIYGIAKKKANIINSLLENVKKASIDCAINTKASQKLTCFNFPVNFEEGKFTYALDINDDTFDIQYNKNIEINEWKGQVLITKKGNFLIRPETNEVYDYDIYLESNKLVKIGILKIIDNKKNIILT